MDEGRGVGRDGRHGVAGEEHLPVGVGVGAGPAAQEVEDGACGVGRQRLEDVARALVRVVGRVVLGEEVLGLPVG